MDWKADQLASLRSDLEMIEWWINAYEGGAVTLSRPADGKKDLSEAALEALRTLRNDLSTLAIRLNEYE